MKSHKPRGISRWSGEIALAIMFITGALALRYVSDGSISEKTATPTPLAPTQIEYTQSELEAFWSEHGKPVIQDQLAIGKYPIKEVQDRYLAIEKIVNKRYGKFGYQLSKIHAMDDRALGGCLFTNGMPKIIIFVPNCMDIYKTDLEKYGNQRDEVFDTLLVGIVLHEMEHLIGDELRPSGGISNEELVRNEEHAWAMTCVYTLCPLVEKHHKILSPGNMIFYNLWLKAGRDEQSPIWDSFVRKNYQDTKTVSDDGNRF